MNHRFLKTALWACVAVAVLAGTLMLLKYMSANETHRPADPATLPAYVERYLELLNAGDEPGLRGHLANPHQPQDAADRIDKYGRLALHDPEVTWTAPEVDSDLYTVAIRAETAGGSTVRLKESVSWQGDESAWLDSDWHWSMSSLGDLDERLPGSWYEPASAGGQALRIADLRRDEGGWYSLRVTYPRFYSSVTKFYESDIDGPGDRRYTTVWDPVNAAAFDMLTYDYDADTLTITRDCRYDRDSDTADVDRGYESRVLARGGR